MSTKKDKINVMHLISALLTGGAEKLLLDHIENSDNKVEYTVVVMNKLVDEQLKARLISAGCNVYFLNRKEGELNLKYLLQLLNIIKKHKIQIVHSHNDGSKMWAILCKFVNSKLKLVYTVHCMDYFKLFNNLKLYLHKKFIDLNIAISRAVFNDCAVYGINKTTHIYNGINIKSLNKKIQISDFSNKYLEINNPLRIINVSRIQHNIKGQDVLINALKICKEKGLKFECLLVGNNNAEYTQYSYTYLKDLIKNLGLENEIKFLGTRHDVPALLAASDLFILSSRFEGLGLVLLEAMVAGLPVLTSNIDGPIELVQNEVNGLVFESGNHQDLAEKIMLLKENMDLRKNLKTNALEYVKQFDISVMCEKYNNLYHSLLTEEVVNTNA